MTEPRLTIAQLRSRSDAQSKISEAIRPLDSLDAVNSVYGAMIGRDGMSAKDLSWLGNKLCQIAWDMERET